MHPFSTDLFMPERALVIVAHSDDIEFGAAGTVIRWTRGGAQVTYVVITNNRSGSNKPNDDLDALVRTREAEQRAAAAVCGVTDVRFLGYPDGMLQPTLELRRDLTRVIRQTRPDVVLVMDPRTLILQEPGFHYINHPDHVAAGTAALHAIFPSAGARPIFPELLAEGLEPVDVRLVYLTIAAQPSLYVDITDVMETKIEALRCHPSQLNEEAFGMVRMMDGEQGKRAGVTYAEAFDVVDMRERDESGKLKV